jgi:hypothetical protein
MRPRIHRITRRDDSIPLGVETSGLRIFLLSGRGYADKIARRLTRRYGNYCGLGIAVYNAGKELACRVSLQTRDVSVMAQLLRALRAEIPE